MKRVIVIGSPGAGKSTLAPELGRRLGLPVIHLDACFWRSGWVEPDRAQWRSESAAMLDRTPQAVIDGNYGSTLDQRIAWADTIIYLDFAPALCVCRLLKRMWRYAGGTRPDMAKGCPERFSAELLLFAWRFRRKTRPRILDRLTASRGTVLRFRTPAELRRWIESLAP